MRTPTVGVAVIKDGQVLLVKHKKKARFPDGVYGFPAGRVEPGEREVECAKRELFEETGLIAETENLQEFDGNYFESTLKLKNGTADFTYRVYYTQSWTGELINNDETEPKWIKIDEINNYPLVHENVVEIIQNCLKFFKIQNS